MSTRAYRHIDTFLSLICEWPVNDTFDHKILQSYQLTVNVRLNVVVGREN